MFFCCSILNAQSKNEIKEIDTSSIIFKAKLFTISKHEYKKQSDYLDFINKLDYEINAKHDFIFIKIKSRIYCLDNNDMFTANWCECDYYVAYSLNKKLFYLLGGFKNDDIKTFAKEFEGSMFSTSWDYKINDSILKSFLDFIIQRKYNKARKCFINCPTERL